MEEGQDEINVLKERKDHSVKFEIEELMNTISDARKRIRAKTDPLVSLIPLLKQIKLTQNLLEKGFSE